MNISWTRPLVVWGLEPLYLRVTYISVFLSPAVSFEQTLGTSVLESDVSVR